MRKKKFDPEKWGNKDKKGTQKTVNTSGKPTVYMFSSNVDNCFQAENILSTNVLKEVNELLQKVEEAKADLTSTYEAWLQIGFALSHAFGENGREFYHRFSQFHPEYDQAACNRQFDHCLRSNKQRITVNTLFYLAAKAGIQVTTKKSYKQEPVKPDSLPDEVFRNLPSILERACAAATSHEERDVILLGSLGVLSSCIPNWSGLYSGGRVYPNLYLFVFAEASAGKGMLNYCRRIVYPIHKALREESAELKRVYQQEKAAYLSAKKGANVEPPEVPPQKLLFIPANNSATGAFQLLDENDGCGLIFETEGDTLANTFKTEYGNYSDNLRKAFHHEPASYYRRGGNEYVEIEKPKLSTVLSGTPRQISNLIPDAENGLFSRFLYFNMSMNAKWKDVFARDGKTGLEEYFDAIGASFFQLHQTLKLLPPTSFEFSQVQARDFNHVFGEWSEEYVDKKGLVATIRRLALSTFRIAMVFTALRVKWEGSPAPVVICNDDDYQAAMGIAKTLLTHAIYAYHELMPYGNTVTSKGRKQQFFDELPFEFSRQVYVDVANNLNIPVKTAERHIRDFTEKGMLLKPMHNQYAKTA
ncbi:DUF3987 domain-containing protein [Fulvivirga kasyanovii]|uniref:DUF3987 domain-containing protein n=1 Tax=Fulvivirga kasyanovii TaxID=396812 RepID=A0ABW9RN10_9BACT|nr:DUF3987 domain-containing protein [Fulvivirga kasyanovii]MTI24738.1 DUF3987 domain-containing protein [Fulvivirga kasyanovii]